MLSWSRFFVALPCLIATLPGVIHAQSSYATPYTITTFAGTPGTIGSVDAMSSAARFGTVNGVAVDASGHVYVADSSNHTIRKITPAGAVTTLAGLAGVSGAVNNTGTAARFNYPTGVTVDSVGNLYVAEYLNHTIRKITPTGAVTTLAGLAGSLGEVDGVGTAARFSNPYGIAVDGTGNVYVSDASGHSIRKITPAGAVSLFAGGAGGAAGTAGNSDGVGAGAGFQGPVGLAIDVAGNLLVADFGNNSIRRITPAGAVMTLAGSTTGVRGSADGIGTAARFSGPYGVAVDSAGNVFVVESSNYTVRKITPAGVVTTLAGSVGVRGVLDGAGSAARFDTPTGLAVDSSGNLYIGDANNHAIRLAAPPGGAKIFGVTIPLLIPAGATGVETRGLAESGNGGVLVAIAGSYAVRPSGGIDARALSFPNFTNPQPYNLSYVVRLLANGQPDPTFTSAPGGDGTINAFAVQPADGKIVVAGTFTKFNGSVFKNLGRLNADGSADSSFNPGSGPDAQVNAIALQSDGKILAGGTFQNFQGLARSYLVRATATGAIDAAFTCVLNGVVNAIALQSDGKIFIGGNFTAVGGVARNRVARLLSTGALDPTFDPGAGANGEVVGLLPQSDGAIVVGGEFTSFAGQNRSRIVRLVASGAIDPAFSSTASANDTVIALGLDESGNILLGGAFTQINGAVRNRIARLLPDGMLDLTFDSGAGANKDVRAVLPRNDGTVFIGGLFDQYQGAAVNEVVALTAKTVATAFVQLPRAITVSAGSTARFYADATGPALAYQWYKDDVAIAGATGASLILTNVTTSAQGRYTLRATSATGAIIAADAVLTVAPGPPGQIVNLSVLTALDAPGDTFTLGFVIGGTGTSGAKPLLVRAAGPALSVFGVGNPLADPKLEFFANGTKAGENDNWGGAAALSGLITQVGAFPYTSAASNDAAFAANPTTASNSVVVSGVGTATGAVIAEVYDASLAGSVTATTPRLINVSVLKHIPAGATLTAGFVIGGSTAKTVLIRAVGPTLSTFGVGGPLADPKLTLNQSGLADPIATNDNWGGAATLKTAMSAVGAFALDPSSKDAAMLITLQPGSYTAQANGVGAIAGSALVEVYEVP